MIINVINNFFIKKIYIISDVHQPSRSEKHENDKNSEHNTAVLLHDAEEIGTSGRVENHGQNVGQSCQVKTDSYTTLSIFKD